MARMTPEEAAKAIGIKNGRLNPCPPMKNCVCSNCKKPYDIAPLKIQDPQPLKVIKQALAQDKGYKIITESSDYIHATFTSGFFKFVDDIEFYWIAKDKLVHVRSASRLGYYDFGANRDRIERLRSLLNGSR